MAVKTKRRSKVRDPAGVMNRIYATSSAKVDADVAARDAARAAIKALDDHMDAICMGLAVIDSLPEADAEQVRRAAAYWCVGIEKGK